jgi:hypothetical protein
MFNTKGTNQHKKQYKFSKTGAFKFFRKNFFIILLFISPFFLWAIDTHFHQIIYPCPNDCNPIVKIKAMEFDLSVMPTVTPMPTPMPTPVVNPKDPRLEAVKKYLQEKNSPLAGSSAYFIDAADRNALDWTLMVSIAGKESSFGKDCVEPFNPFGITTGKKTGPRFQSFTSFTEAIYSEGKLLSDDYKLNSNRAIGSKYCPASECSSTWAEDVTNFSKQLLKKVGM